MIEIIEKDNEILNNKVFETLNSNKSESVGQALLNKLNMENDYSDFLVLVLKVKYSQDFTKLDMFGLTGLDYILNSVNFCETKIVEYNLEEDIIKTIKNNLNNKKYVAVVFSDTPLIKKHTFLEILDYFKFKSLCALKFNRGYVFDCEYLKSVEKVYNPQVQYFYEEDFVKVVDEKSFASTLEILKNRILNYHLNKGVIIKDINSTFIDAEVNIDKGVIIENNVNILGKTVIKQNSQIGVNTKIKNAIINENCFIENSIIENAIIKQNSNIKDFCVIKNVTIEENENKSYEKIVGSK